ncbi:unnamed protein product [Acanthocheilonema viteae]|uniref:Uncharacterized protein n=1 Tax=Acanthocheilonema viteae TaxID=6277 RepID=A0A498SPI9_ACAVI|nr:unnamed protein product [Acanthocheilonema viteae]
MDVKLLTEGTDETGAENTYVLLTGGIVSVSVDSYKLMGNATFGVACVAAADATAATYDYDDNDENKNGRFGWLTGRGAHRSM